RLFLGHFTVADSTALHAEARHRLRELSRRYGYLGCLLIFNASDATCLAHDLVRERKVGPQVIAYHMGLLQQALREAPYEGWEQVHVLGEQDMDAEVVISMP